MSWQGSSVQIRRVTVQANLLGFHPVTRRRRLQHGRVEQTHTLQGTSSSCGSRTKCAQQSVRAQDDPGTKCKANGPSDITGAGRRCTVHVIFAKSEVLTVVTLHVTPCNLVDMYGRSDLAVGSFKTLVTIYQTSWRHIPEHHKSSFLYGYSNMATLNQFRCRLTNTGQSI